MRLISTRLAFLALLATLVLAGGVALPSKAGDESAITTIMEQVQARNRAIGKALRADTALGEGGRRSVATDAKSLVRLAKEARALADPAREKNKPQGDWTRLVDGLIQASDDFARGVTDPTFARPQVEKSYQRIQKACAQCHATFRE
jgi:hypothetical protein